ncbi:MAG: S41 family peptidase [bacterium]|nr:S41 family peptidase [bacterium]
MNIKVQWKVIIAVVLEIVLIAGVGFGGFYFGVSYTSALPHEITVNIGNLNGSSTAPDFNTFLQALQIVKTDALHGNNLTDKDLLYGAIRGVVGSLKDPHSVFMPPPDAKKFTDEISGSFGGVGMEIGKKDGRLVVIAPLKDSPAEKAGLLANDFIIKVNATFTETLDVEQAVDLIRGPKGTKVDLLIAREGWVETKLISVIRDTIQVPTLDYKKLDNNIAQIQLYNFNEHAGTSFLDALKKAEKDNAQRIILDLRNNPGGFLEVAVQIAGLWLPSGMPVVSEEFRDKANGDKFLSQGSGGLKNIPTVILVNGGSASASEILAGALRDNLGIKIIGTTTFGKGTVQILKQLTDGSNIKVTVANWLLPKGSTIEGNGIKPDIEVKITEDQIKKQEDPQLEKAIEEVLKIKPNLVIEKIQ